ncbi:hypothetical protein [Neorhizobium sp. DAR64861/K0K2]|uniref:hypothetical protein n=1 Tax=unclassified Neorhizobium TaxID=2629175 RepID=UPI003D27F8BD
MYVDASMRRALLPLKDKIAATFSESNWIELATLTDTYSLVRHHPRLLRSLSFGDDDYAGNVLSVLNAIIEKDAANFGEIQRYVDSLEGGGTLLSSTATEGPRYYIQPTVFKIPKESQDPNLVSVMMPFSPQFARVFDAIKNAARSAGLQCLRVDDIWQDSVLVQDIFSLIVRSRIVVCDFSGKNPNVFYEAGIAHTLGKLVVPITQSGGDVPADLRHHRYLEYLNNGEGLADLEKQLSTRLTGVRSQWTN